MKRNRTLLKSESVGGWGWICIWYRQAGYTIIHQKRYSRFAIGRFNTYQGGVTVS